MLVVDQLLGVAAALLLAITATALVTNDEKEIAPLVVVAMFELFAHGGTLFIALSPFGVIDLSAALVVIALMRVASGRATLGLARWSGSNPSKTAHTAEPAASRTLHATFV